MTDTEWTGMRNHHTIAVRVSDDHYRYLREQKAAGTPIVEIIRQALTRHIAAQAATVSMPDSITVHLEGRAVHLGVRVDESGRWDAGGVIDPIQRRAVDEAVREHHEFTARDAALLQALGDDDRRP